MHNIIYIYNDFYKKALIFSGLRGMGNLKAVALETIVNSVEKRRVCM